MSKAVFASRRNEFHKRNDAFVDMMLGHMAIDIEIALKTSSGMPVDKGQMKAATRSFKSRRGQYKVEINKEYAAVQEAGVRLTGKGAPAVIEHYSTSGTSHHFFQRAIDAIVKNKETYAVEARKALDL